MYLASIIIQSLVLGTQISLIAVCMYLVNAASRIIHLAVGTIGVVAAYALYFGVLSGWPLWSGALLALGIAVLLGLLAAGILEPFAVKQEPLFGLLVALAMGIIIEAVIAIFFGTDGKSLQAGVLSVVNVGSVQIDLPGLITIMLGIFIAFLAWTSVHFTEIGRLLRSVAENPSLSVSLGVNGGAVRRIVHITTAVVGAIIVILAGWHTALTPEMSTPIVFAAFIALFMGGINDIRGTIAASYIVAVIPGLIIGFTSGLSDNWRLVFVFLIAAIVLAFRPNGIFAQRVREA